jgi:transposase
MTVEPLTGRCSARVTLRRTYIDYAEHLRWLVDEAYPDADCIVVVNNNLNIHTTVCLYEAFEPAEAHRIKNRLEMHHTPEHASWMNMAESDLSILSR